MIEVTGNFWDYAESGIYALVVTTNGVVKKDGSLIMGAGIAKDFRDLFPDLDSELGDKVARIGNRPHWVNLSGCDIISLPTKKNWKDDSSYTLIMNGAVTIRDWADQYPDMKWLCTRPGCGNGNLKWDVVKKILTECGWDDRFTIVEM